MKLVIDAAEGEHFFDLIDTVPGVEWVRPAKADLLAEIADADAYYGWPTPELVTAAKQLQWVQSPGAGVDWVLRFPAFAESDIVLTNTRGAHALSIAEHTFALLLALTRAIPQSVVWQQQKEWPHAEAYRIPSEINGLTIGILGYGHIGRMIARRAAGFDMPALAVDLYPGAGDDYVQEVWPVERLHEMVSRSDVIAVAAPLTDSTRGMLNHEAFAAAKKGCYVIAVSRGGIIDEAALMQAIDRGVVAAAGLDVTSPEPPPADSPLWEHPKVLLTPHSAGSSWQKEKRCVEILVENLRRFVAGEELVNVCDKFAGF